MDVKKTRLVLLGGGGHAKVLANVILRLPQYELIGYVDPKNQGSLFGVPHLGGDEVLSEISVRGSMGAVLGVGKVRARSNRIELLERLERLGFSLPPIIAPSATVARDVILGPGTVVMDGAVVQPGCVVGRGGILNTNCSLDHSCILGNDVHVATGASLSGDVSVGDGALVGVGASVLQGVRIMPSCTIGAGAAVIRDCMESGTYVGVPARRLGSCVAF